MIIQFKIDEILFETVPEARAIAHNKAALVKVMQDYYAQEGLSPEIEVNDDDIVVVTLPDEGTKAGIDFGLI